MAVLKGILDSVYLVLTASMFAGEDESGKVVQSARLVQGLSAGHKLLERMRADFRLYEFCLAVRHVIVAQRTSLVVGYDLESAQGNRGDGAEAQKLGIDYKG